MKKLIFGAFSFLVFAGIANAESQFQNLEQYFYAPAPNWYYNVNGSQSAAQSTSLDWPLTITTFLYRIWQFNEYSYGWPYKIRISLTDAQANTTITTIVDWKRFLTFQSFDTPQQINNNFFVSSNFQTNWYTKPSNDPYIAASRLCLYDPTTGTTETVTTELWTDWVWRRQNIGCPITHNWMRRLLWVGWSDSLATTSASDIIQTQKKNEIAGLTCQTDLIPNYNATVWSNYGALPISANISDDTAPNLAWLQQWGSWSGDRDISVWYKSGTWSILPKESFMYPWTADAILLDYQNEIGTLSINSVRGGRDNPFNIFEFSNTSNIAFGKAWGFTVTDSISGVNYDTTVLSSSWGLAVGSLWNSSGYMKNLEVSLLWKFNWFRIWRAPNIAKTACYTNFNICEFSQEWASLLCQPAKSGAGIDFWGCEVTGSGSLYWSGSCVPTRDISGNIIPPNPLAGGYVTYDANGNIVSTVNPPTTTSFLTWVFSCNIDYAKDSWYWIVWKALTCPITVFGNLYNKVYNSYSKAQSGIDQISWISKKWVEWAKVDTSTGASYTGSNLLVKSLLINEQKAGENKYIKIFKISLMAIFAVFALAFLISIIKNRNS